MYVYLELENGNAYPQRGSHEEPPADRARAGARSGYRLFLVLLLVVLTVLLVLEVTGSAAEAELRPDAGSALQPDAPAIEEGPAPDLSGISWLQVLGPIQISGIGSLPIVR